MVEQLALFPAPDEPGIDWTTVDVALVHVSGEGQGQPWPSGWYPSGAFREGAGGSL